MVFSLLYYLAIFVLFDLFKSSVGPTSSSLYYRCRAWAGGYKFPDCGSEKAKSEMYTHTKRLVWWCVNVSANKMKDGGLRIIIRKMLIK
jgi:hypothetical protein